MSAISEQTDVAESGGAASFRRVVRDLAESRLAVLGFVLFLAVSLIAILAPWISPQDPHGLASLNLLDSRLPPGSVGFAGETYLLGSDEQGRDMLSAIFYGLRTSLTVGLLSSTIALIFGTTLGLIAGYFGGRVDSLIMRVVDLQLAIPSILVALILLAILGRGIDKIIIALVTVQWIYFARTVRGSCLVERGKEYVQAAKLLGYSHFRILFVHILPNTLPPVTVVLTVEFAHAIALEATLSFLGLGLPVTEPSLGMLISNGVKYMMSGRTWISVYPGIALIVLIVAINLVGDHLRDILNPRLNK